MVDGGGPQAQLRPLDLWRSPRVGTLAGEGAAGPPAGGLVDRDVEPGGANRLVAAVKAPAVPELRHDGHGGEPAHAVELVLQRPAPRLGLGEGDELGAEGDELGVEV